jgi:hypothetical protein
MHLNQLPISLADVSSFAIAKIASLTYPKFDKIICGAFIDCLSKKEDLLYDKFADENHIREETNSYQSI